MTNKAYYKELNEKVAITMSNDNNIRFIMAERL